jgi:hypothetical protein
LTLALKPVIYALEHELIANGHACNVVRAIGLDGLLDNIPLAFVGSVIIRGNGIIAKVDGEVYFGLLDSFQYQSGLVAVGAVETETGGKLRQQLNILDDMVYKKMCLACDRRPYRADYLPRLLPQAGSCEPSGVYAIAQKLFFRAGSRSNLLGSPPELVDPDPEDEDEDLPPDDLLLFETVTPTATAIAMMPARPIRPPTNYKKRKHGRVRVCCSHEEWKPANAQTTSCGNCPSCCVSLATGRCKIGRSPC